jgi:Fe-S cluster biogenesis protein NfuA
MVFAMYIETEDTPNPQSLKFVPDRPVLSASPDGKAQPGFDFPNSAAAEASPLAAGLFGVDGVVGVFIGPDFVTVTKEPTVEWMHLKPAVLSLIADHLVAGLPVMSEGGTRRADPATPVTDYEAEDREVVEKIIALIDTRVRPAVAADGGDIAFRHYEPKTGIVFLSMHGSCSGCPSSTATLKAGIENMLKHYVPEVVKVEAA